MVEVPRRPAGRRPSTRPSARCRGPAGRWRRTRPSAVVVAAPDDDRRGALPGHPADRRTARSRGSTRRRTRATTDTRRRGSPSSPTPTPRPPRPQRPRPPTASTTTTADLPGTTLEAANEGDGDSAAPWLIGAGIAALLAIVDRRTGPQAPRRRGQGRRAPSPTPRQRPSRDRRPRGPPRRRPGGQAAVAVAATVRSAAGGSDRCSRGGERGPGRASPRGGGRRARPVRWRGHRRCPAIARTW